MSPSKRLGYSKSMLCLQQILQIIDFYPSQQTPTDQLLSSQIQENRSFTSEKRGLDIDLNRASCQEKSDSVITACSVIDKVLQEKSSTVGFTFSGDPKSTEGGCDDPHVVTAQSSFEAATETEDNSEPVCLQKEYDGLSRLVEATEMVSNEEDLQKAKDRSKRKLKEDLHGGYIRRFYDRRDKDAQLCRLDTEMVLSY